MMQTENIVAAVILIILVGVVIGVRFYKLRKEGKTLEDFISMYGNCIIEALKDSIRILTLKIDNYKTKEEYEKAIIDATVVYIKTNYTTLGIDVGFLENAINNGLLTDIIYNIFNKNYKEAFSDISTEIINTHYDLYDTETLYSK